MDRDTSGNADLGQKQTKAYKLADYGGNSCTGNTHIKNKDKKGIQANIKNGTGSDANHSIKCIALETDLIV